MSIRKHDDSASIYPIRFLETFRLPKRLLASRSDTLENAKCRPENPMLTHRFVGDGFWRHSSLQKRASGEVQMNLLRSDGYNDTPAKLRRN